VKTSLQSGSALPLLERRARGGETAFRSAGRRHPHATDALTCSFSLSYARLMQLPEEEEDALPGLIGTFSGGTCPLRTWVSH